MSTQPYFRLYFQFILVGGLLIRSDTCIDTCIMAKNRCYLAHICKLWTCCDLENSVKSPKVTDLISIYIALYLYSC